MTGAARIIVRLPGNGGAPAWAEYRPLNDLTALLAGIAVDEVPNVVSLLFAICGAAHRHAANLAVDAALGRDRGRDARATAETAALFEAAREHGIGIARNWASQLGEPADHATARAFVEAARLGTAEAIDAAIARHITRIAPAAWLAMTTADELCEWADTTPSVAARFIRAQLSQPGLRATAGGERGTLIDIHADHPLLTDQSIAGTLRARFVARLVDLCQLPARIAGLESGQAEPIAGTSASPGRGRASVHCARGALEHAVRIEGDRIVEYRIVSPTDRAFASDGCANRQLAALPSAPLDIRKCQAELVIQALDPCAAYVIEVA